MSDVQIEYQKLADVIPAERNPKDHDLGAIQSSIGRFGFTSPVLIDERTGQLVAGHGRLEALQQMRDAGQEPPERIEKNGSDWLVPVIRGVGFRSDVDAEAYLVADNRLTDLGGWDESALADVLRDLAENDALEGVGYDADDVESMIKELDRGENPNDPDDAPEPPADPVTKRGDVWLFGKHRVMCGDSTMVDDVETLMDGEKADMVFTDPPYGVDYTGGTKLRERLAADNLQTDIYAECMPLLASYSKAKAALYLWHADRSSMPPLLAIAENHYEVRSQIIWSKNQAQFGALGAQYKQKHEPCYYCFKSGNAPFWDGPNNEVTVWEVNREPSNDYHPTQKPVELAERALGNSCEVGGSVLDVFAGSGSTLIAAEKTGRTAYLMELSEQYVDVICRRYQEYTGEKPILESTGETYDFTQPSQALAVEGIDV